MSTKFSKLELDLFVEHTCGRCFQPDEATKRMHNGRGRGCPHKHRAVERDQMPGAWTRRRNSPLGETFKCTDFAPQPPSNRRKTEAADTEAMFDLAPGVKTLVPVDGWPDYRAEAAKDSKGDHQ